MQYKWIFSVIICLFFSATALSQQNKKPLTKPFKPALLVIDIQNQYLPSMDQKDVVPGLKAINKMIDLFRANKHPVVRVYHTQIGQGPKPGTDPFEFPKTVRIKDDDPKIIKNYPSGFTKTDLDKILKEKGVTAVYITGLSAVACALATYFGAMDRGYDTIMVREAIISHNADYTNMIRNVTMTMPVDMVSLSMKLLSGDVKTIESLPAKTLIKRYGISNAKELNSIGYYLIFQNRSLEAIMVLKTNARLFPDEPNCYDSLGDAYERNHQKDLALSNYEKAYIKAKKKNHPNLSVYKKNFQRLKEALK